jgi:hypothetical protein
VEVGPPTGFGNVEEEEKILEVELVSAIDALPDQIWPARLLAVGIAVVSGASMRNCGRSSRSSNTNNNTNNNTTTTTNNNNNNTTTNNNNNNGRAMDLAGAEIQRVGGLYSAIDEKRQ